MVRASFEMHIFNEYNSLRQHYSQICKAEPAVTYMCFNWLNHIDTELFNFLAILHKLANAFR